MKEFIETGKIVNIHGLRGEVKIMPWSDDPDFICGFDILYCGKDKKIFEIESARVHKNIVYIDRNDVELEEGTYFIQDLIGLKVTDADTNEEYGTVRDVFQTGANDVYEVKNGERTVLIPAIPDVIVNTDLENSVLTIRPLEGLFDED